jgi:uncharacterized protein (DUF2147 family)
MKLMRTILSLSFLLLFLPLFSQGVLGKWKTIDDESGKVRSVVEIYEKSGKVYGRVIKLFRDPKEDPNPSCVACTDDRKGKKVIGMDIMRDMVRDGEEYEEGTILDPKTGKIYDCKIWIEEGKLQVRGYIAFLFRTQTWLPYKE